MSHKKINFKNIIKVNGDEITLQKEDNALTVTLSDKLDFYDIIKMNIEVEKDTSLLIEYKGKKEVKLDICINVKPNVYFSIYEKKEEDISKIQMKYYIYDNAKVNVEKFYDIKEMKELNIVYLNGVGASYKSSIKGIIKGQTKLDVLMYHNYPKTNSDVEHKFVTIKDGLIKLNVTSMVYHNRKNCIVNQSNHILNENSSKSYIKPNLLIEENDIEASHSANIAPFDYEKIFFMQSRGLDELTVKKILLKGFLNTNLIEIEKYINKYWR